MKQAACLIAVSLILSGTPILSATAHDAPKRCGRHSGTGAGWYKVRGHGPVSCKKARAVARRWEHKCVRDDDRSNCPKRGTRIDVSPGYRCRYRDAGHESVRVRCRAREKRIVHFFWGS